jgi:RNA polymerase sigma-70 factor (ECF subfamily)
MDSREKAFHLGAVQPEPDTDEELLQAYRAGRLGRDEIITELFRRYHTRVARWCLRFTQDREMARDVAQEVFLRAYKSLASYRGDSRVSTWIYVIARNQSMTALERRNSHPDHVELNAAVAWADPKSQMAYNRIDDIRVYRPKCRHLLRSLTPMEAAVMMLHYGQDLSLASVTRQLRLTNKSGAKAYIVSARRKLGPIVEQDFEAWVGGVV